MRDPDPGDRQQPQCYHPVNQADGFLRLMAPFSHQDALEGEGHHQYPAPSGIQRALVAYASPKPRQDAPRFETGEEWRVPYWGQGRSGLRRPREHTTREYNRSRHLSEADESTSR